MSLNYRIAVREYRKAWRSIDLRDPQTYEWAAFYRDAHTWCKEVAETYRVSTYSVASIVALTSPRMPWGRNKQVAHRIVDALGQSGGWELRSADDVKAILDGIEKLGITHERRRAVARFVVGDEWNDKALKVTAFRQNLLGDYTPVTIDTWMTKPFGLGSPNASQYAILARAVTTVAAAAYTSPAVVQAILWGYFRQGSGWARHDDYTQTTLEATS